MTKPIGPLSFSNYFKVSSTVLPKVNKIKGQAASFFQKIGSIASSKFEDLRFYFNPSRYINDAIRYHITAFKTDSLRNTPTIHDTATEAEWEQTVQEHSGVIKKEENAFKNAVSDYFKELLGSPSDFQEIKSFVTKIRQMIKDASDKENDQKKEKSSHLPLIFAKLLTLPAEKEADLFSALCPFTPGGLLQLDPKNEQDALLLKKIYPEGSAAAFGRNAYDIASSVGSAAYQSSLVYGALAYEQASSYLSAVIPAQVKNEAAKIVSEASNLATRVKPQASTLGGYLWSFFVGPEDSNGSENQSFAPPEISVITGEVVEKSTSVSLADLRLAIPDEKKRNKFLQDKFKEAMNDPEMREKAEAFLHFVAPSKDPDLEAEGDKSIVEIFISILLPKLLTLGLERLKTIGMPSNPGDPSSLLDRTLWDLKEHFEFLSKSEKVVEETREIIFGYEQSLKTNENFEGLDTYRSNRDFSIAVFGQDLLPLTSQERKRIIESSEGVQRANAYFESHLSHGATLNVDAFARQISRLKTETITEKRINLIHEIWGCNVALMSLENRELFLNSNGAKRQVENYLKEVRYRELGAHAALKEKNEYAVEIYAVLNSSLPADRIKELSEISLDLWKMPLEEFLALSPQQKLSIIGDEAENEVSEYAWAIDAVLNHSISPEKIKALSELSRSAWNMSLQDLLALSSRDKLAVFREAAYKAFLKKKTAEQVSSVVGNYLTGQISPALLLEVVEEIQDKHGSVWQNLLISFPPLKNLIPQLRAYDPSKTEKEKGLNFIGFVTGGLPNLIRRGVENILVRKVVPADGGEKKYITDYLEAPNLEKMMDESVLPSALSTLNGMILETVIHSHLSEIAGFLVEEKTDQGMAWDRFNDFKKKLKKEYLDHLKNEKMDLPPEFLLDGIEEVIENSLLKLEEALRPAIKEIQKLPEKNQKKAMVETLKLFFAGAPGDAESVYPETLMTLLFDLGGLPNIFKQFVRSSPLYPIVGSKVSVIITSAISAYRKSTREALRQTTGLCESLLLPTVPTTPFEIRLPIASILKVDQLISEIPFDETMRLEAFLKEHPEVGSSGKVMLDQNKCLIISFTASKEWIEKNRETPVADLLTRFNLNDLRNKLAPEGLRAPLRERLLSEKIRKLAAATLLMTKLNLGIKTGTSLSNRLFKWLLPVDSIGKLFEKVIRKVLFSGADYHLRLIKTFAETIKVGRVV